MSGLPTITSQQLRSYEAGDELRAEGAGKDKELKTKTTNWFQRFIRLISIPFRAPDKNYGDAKLAILEALTTEYGKKIGESVFRAHIGELDYGKTSPYDPITGRQIRRMVEQGDREILEKYAQEQKGGINYAGLWSTPSGGPVPGRPDPATRDWMMCKFENRPSRYDRLNRPNFDPFPSWRDVNLRSSRVDIGKDSEKKESYYQSMARGLLTDLERRNAKTPSERGYAWTLDIQFTDEHGSRPTTTMGLRISPDFPDMINIFDVNHCEVTVARKDLSAWLQAHIEKHYPHAQLDLFRAEQIMSRNFREDDDGVVKAEFEFELEDKPLRDQLVKKYGNSLKEHSPGKIGDVVVSSILERDISRASIEISTPDRSYGLGPGNFYSGMKALLDDGTLTDNELREAIYNLSVILNQDLGTEGCTLYERKIREHLSVAMTYASSMDSTFHLSRTNDNPPSIRIDVDMTRGYRGMGADVLKDWEYFDQKSNVHTSYSVSIRLDHLLEDDGWKKLEVTQSMHSRCQFQPKTGEFEPFELKGTKSLTLHDRDGKLQTSGRIQNSTIPAILQNIGGKPVSESWGVELNQQFLEELGSQSARLRFGEENGGHLPLTLDHVHQALPGLEPQGKTNLSHLLAPSTGNTLFENMVDIHEIDPDTANRALTTVTPIVRDGVNYVDIEYRCPVPEGLLESRFVLYPEPPPQPGHFESVIRMRIPVEQLNNGLPQTYDMLHPSRLEWIGDEN